MFRGILELLSHYHLDPRYLLPVLVDVGEVPEELSPLPVVGVLEPRVVRVQVLPVDQHLLAVVQLLRMRLVHVAPSRCD